MMEIMIFQKGQVSSGKKFRYEYSNFAQDFFHSNEYQVVVVILKIPKSEMYRESRAAADLQFPSQIRLPAKTLHEWTDH